MAVIKFLKPVVDGHKDYAKGAIVDTVEHGLSWPEEELPKFEAQGKIRIINKVSPKRKASK